MRITIDHRLLVEPGAAGPRYGAAMTDELPAGHLGALPAGAPSAQEQWEWLEQRLAGPSLLEPPSGATCCLRSRFNSSVLTPSGSGGGGSQTRRLTTCGWPATTQSGAVRNLPSTSFPAVHWTVTAAPRLPLNTPRRPGCSHGPDANLVAKLKPLLEK